VQRELGVKPLAESLAASLAKPLGHETTRSAAAA